MDPLATIPDMPPAHTRIVVTGGAGFVGSHLIDQLLTDGHDVLSVDNYSTGRRRNLDHHATHPNLELIRHDVTQPLYVECDLIFHLACPASPVHYQTDPIQTTKTAVLGTLNMLGLARRTGAKFVLASTSEVYGDPVPPGPVGGLVYRAAASVHDR